MRKIITLTLILLILFLGMSSVYASSSFTVTMKGPENKVNKNEEFTVEVKLSNIQDERGIIALGGEIDYDNDSLTLVKLESASDTWAKPTYNKESKKFVMDREDLSKDDENIFKIRFKVNDNSAKNPKVSLKNLVGSNGNEDINTSDVTISVNVNTEAVVNPTTSPSTEPSSSPTTSPTTSPTIKPTQSPSSNNNSNNNNSNNNNNGGSSNNSSKNNDTKKITTSNSSESLPFTGNENIVIGILCIAIAALATISFIKIKEINKKARK